MKTSLICRAKQLHKQQRAAKTLGRNAFIRRTAMIAVVMLTIATIVSFSTASRSRVAASTNTIRKAVAVAPALSPAPSPATTRQVKPRPIQLPLVGYADMHTHPMSHLGFGKKLVHGAPDVGSLIPKGTRNCNKTDYRAQNMADALGNCNSTHGGWGVDNPCGDTLRAAVLNHGLNDQYVYKVPPEENLHGDHHHPGQPDFKYWPHQSSLLHQQMWWEWLKRAHEGGLRVMVALSVNNQLLAEAINGDAPTKDVPSSDLQVKEIKDFVGRHNDFMEVAYSSEDLRRIVGKGKLAVILGMEIDDFGGFSQMPNFNLLNDVAKKILVKNEIKRVYDLGVRYLFPIHLTNNVFGGTAAYKVLFNFANKHNTGEYLTLQHTNNPTIKFNINFTPYLPSNSVIFSLRSALEIVADSPAPCVNDVSCLPGGKVRCCSNAWNAIKEAMTPDLKWATYDGIPPGQINAQGLTPLGEFAIQEMMKLGIMLDVDHMGAKSIYDSIRVAKNFNGGYPVNMGHNNMRKNEEGHDGTERNLDGGMARAIAESGGMIGVGSSDLTADEFVNEYHKVLKEMSDDGRLNVFPAIGTDVNGMEPLPKGSFGLLSSNFYKNGLTKQQTGNRVWDYTKDGVAHYGLMKEFMIDVKNRPSGKGAEVYTKLRSSAEYFARMWEKCEDVAGLN